ncbi:DUF3265 domain-containing protein [Vibrio vulnificus]|nr:DUF3265 domain-containing protein [Vibrio vulnificus]HAS6031819.1 DUF3265 domain-containing protein [Vibrio vulnificus]HAS6116954.1 DUF3265 domain-containing protein [Vibrio vulnificus]HAS6126335.1 DUF3265 domain-containing protein [Vibrio vulnificus]HAS6131036.1 DUF3265 domain-containing protein [Vibrio vulnificus]
MIRNAWRSHFRLNLVFTAPYSSSVYALLTR